MRCDRIYLPSLSSYAICSLRWPCPLTISLAKALFASVLTRKTRPVGVVRILNALLLYKIVKRKCTFFLACRQCPHLFRPARPTCIAVSLILEMGLKYYYGIVPTIESSAGTVRIKVVPSTLKLPSGSGKTKHDLEMSLS